MVVRLSDEFVLLETDHAREQRIRALVAERYAKDGWWQRRMDEEKDKPVVDETHRIRQQFGDTPSVCANRLDTLARAWKGSSA